MNGFGSTSMTSFGGGSFGSSSNTFGMSSSYNSPFGSSSSGLSSGLSSGSNSGSSFGKDSWNQPLIVSNSGLFGPQSTGTSTAKIGQVNNAGNSWYDHYDDCDKAYHNSPVENFVCSESEKHHFMDSTRECLQQEKADGKGFIKRHLDCWSKAATGKI